MGVTLSRIRNWALIGCATAALTCGAALADGAKLKFAIAAQDLASALTRFAEQSDREILFSPDATARKRAAAVSGEFSPEEALTKLLAGTGLTFRATGANTLLVVAPQANAAPATQTAQAQTPPAAGDQPKEQEKAEDDRKVERVVVTGSRVKGVKDRFSPVTTITRDQMDIAGQGNVSDIFNTLPTNFGGGASPDTIRVGTPEGVGGASVNLRGLGNDATLILLNGRRLAPGGTQGNYVDISAIPTTAISRVEVMTDGASAIYGSDAVAGVVNIILRDDFDGAESRVNLSTISDGGGETFRAGQLLGISDEGAHGLLAYEYAAEGELNAIDKDWALRATRPTYLTPFSQKNNVFASGGLDLSDSITVAGDAYYNKRKSKGFSSNSTPSLVQQYQQNDVDQFGAAAGINVRLFGDWEGDISSSYSKSDQFSDVIFLHAVGGNFADASTEIVTGDVSFGGSLFDLTDEPVKAVLGLHSRSESFEVSTFLHPTNAKVGTIKNDRDVFAAFGEIYAPLILEGDASPIANRLAITAAARYETYSDVGSSFDPKFGVAWSPFSGLNIRGTWGTSFHAARLEQLRDDIGLAALGVYADPISPTGKSVVLVVAGTTSDLDPEEATAWTAGFDFNPETIEGLRVRGTYFDVAYEGRIGTPTVGFNSQFQFTNFTGVPVRNPSAADVQAFVASARTFLNYSVFFPSLGPLSLQDVTVILDQRPQNITTSRVDGVDLDVGFETGHWAFTLNSTVLMSNQRQFSPLTPVESLADKFGNPIDVRLRGGVTWRDDTAVAALFVNYVDNYIDNGASAGSFPVASWTTLDASVRLDLGEIFGGYLGNDASLVLTVTNLLNEDPPVIGTSPVRAAVYDPANADPTGRRVGVLLTKQW